MQRGGAIAADKGEGLQGALMGAGAGAVGGGALGAGASMAAPFAQDAYGVLSGHAGNMRDELSEAMRYRAALMGSGGSGVAAGSAAGGFKGGSDISELLRKIASGGSLTNSPKNTAADAAKHDELAALDLKNRAAGAYVGVQGHTTFPNVNQTEAPRPMPGAPKVHPNTVSSREIKAASDLSQDDQIFLHLFNKAASEVGQYLPSNMDENTKVAHLRRLMGLDNAERVSYLNALYGQR